MSYTVLVCTFLRPMQYFCKHEKQKAAVLYARMFNKLNIEITTLGHLLYMNTRDKRNTDPLLNLKKKQNKNWTKIIRIYNGTLLIQSPTGHKEPS